MELTKHHLEGLKVVLNRRELARQLPRHGRVAEIGVNRGAFASVIWEMAAPAELHLIDPWDTERFGEREFLATVSTFRTQIASGSVKVHRMRALQALSHFPDGYLDWVYLDTTHGYHETLEELKACEAKISRRGFIAGHDYTVGNFEKGIRYGVIEAVNSFCLTHHWSIAFITFESDRCHSYALRRLELKVTRTSTVAPPS